MALKITTEEPSVTLEDAGGKAGFSFAKVYEALAKLDRYDGAVSV